MCNEVMKIESLLIRFQADNKEVAVQEITTQIYQAFKDMVFRSALGFTGFSVEDAEDAASDFWELFTKNQVFARYDTKRKSFHAWISVVVRYKLIDCARKTRDNQCYEVSIDDDANHEADKVADPKVRDPEEILLDAEIGKNIRKAVGQLSPRQRDIFTQQQTGASVKEISDDLQLSLNTVKAHLRVANQKLRQLLLPIYNELTD